MDKLKKLKASYQKCVDDMKALLDGSDEFTDEQQAKFDELKAKAESLKTQIANHEQVIKEEAEAARMVDSVPALERQVKPDSNIITDPTASPIKSKPFEVPAQAKRWSTNLKSFTGPDADVKAYRAGMWLAATLLGSSAARRFCKDYGIPISKVDFGQMQLEALHQEGVNTSGGYLVPDEYERTIIRLVEEYGLVRRKMKRVPMLGDTKIQPRRTGGLTAYFVGEGASITESTGSWDSVKLVTRKLAAITTASNELLSDAIVSIADEITREISLAFATKEDICGFQGDGTSTYGGIVGVVTKLSTINGVDDGGGLSLGSNNTYAEVVDTELTKMIGMIPNYPGIRPEWYCSKPFWAQVMLRLTRAVGGATMSEFEEARRPMYAGYPVNWTSGTTAMPVTVANSQISCLFGDLSMAAHFGDRAGIALATSTDAYVGSTSVFDTDAFAIRGVERFDINVHDAGTSSAAGPIVGFIQAAA